MFQLISSTKFKILNYALKLICYWSRILLLCHTMIVAEEASAVFSLLELETNKNIFAYSSRSKNIHCLLKFGLQLVQSGFFHFSQSFLGHGIRKENLIAVSHCECKNEQRVHHSAIIHIINHNDNEKLFIQFHGKFGC